MECIDTTYNNFRKYPVNREFRKTLRHNKHNYTLRSVFDDTEDRFDFDKAISMMQHRGRFDFDRSIESVSMHDYLDELYSENQDIF